jgi:hypothetical protein
MFYDVYNNGLFINFMSPGYAPLNPPNRGEKFKLYNFFLLP